MKQMSLEQFQTVLDFIVNHPGEADIFRVQSAVAAMFRENRQMVEHMVKCNFREATQEYWEDCISRWDD